MASKIKSFNFNGCQHLRKVVIDSEVEFEGKIDLSDTPISQKNNVYDYNVDVDDTLPFSPNPLSFKDVPDGIAGKPEILKSRIKLKTETAEIDTQTDPVEILSLGELKLSDEDNKMMELMNDNLFWYNDFRVGGKKEYLEQRRNNLKQWINSDIAIRINDSVKLLAEHILLVNEKILENAKYFDELGNIIKPQNKQWASFHKFLTEEIFDLDGIEYKIKIDGKLNTQLDISTPKLPQHAISRFMKSLEASMEKDGSKYYTFHNYDKNTRFSDYYNNDSRYIGIKPREENGNKTFIEKSLGRNGGEKALERLYDYWKKNRLEESLNVEDNKDIYRKWYNEMRDKLDKFEEKIDPTWKKFWSWCEKYIVESNGEVKKEKKTKYPNLNPATFQLFYLTIDSGRIATLNVNIPWANHFHPNFVFGDAVKRAYQPLEYNEFGSIFNEWRKTIYIPNNT